MNVYSVLIRKEMWCVRGELVNVYGMLVCKQM